MDKSIQKQIVKLSSLKLKPYNKFIKKLLKIEEKGIVFEKNYRKLRDLFHGSIMLYLKKDSVQIIMANLIIIGRCVGMGNENSRLREELRTPVFAIVNILLRDIGFDGKLDEEAYQELEKAEDDIFPMLFKQAIKEALDNVLFHQSDYCLFKRGEYVRGKNGEYIIFFFNNDHPRGCKIIIGPFNNIEGEEILFTLYVPRYIQIAVPQVSVNKRDVNSYIDICIDEREMPLSISEPLKDSCLIELEQEDCYNDFIPSFSFNNPDSIAPYRHNYSEIAFAIGQRAKYIYLHAHIPLGAMHLYQYIEQLENIDPFAIYPATPWELNEDGDLVDLG
jgi:hypothetical protein